MMEPIRRVRRVSAVQQALVPGEPVGQRVTPRLTTVASVSLTFESWYAATRPTLARALALSIGDDDLAREAIDEAMTRAYATWPRVSQLENPAGWVYRVAMNWAISVFRRRRRPQRTVHALPIDMPMPMDATVAAAFDALDVKHRAVVVCRYLLGWSERETAEALKIPAGTVKSRLSRATADLRTQLDHLRPEDPR
jgi:DNA-directed RNA polymerase specialized sigma24 family protein